jgi:hypothetical protein
MMYHRVYDSPVIRTLLKCAQSIWRFIAFFYKCHINKKCSSRLSTLSYYTSRCTYKVLSFAFFATYALPRQSILEGMVPLPKHMSRLEKNIVGLNLLAPEFYI